MINRIRVSEPKPRGDGKLRGVTIPKSVEMARQQQARTAASGGSSTDLPDVSAPPRRTQKDMQEEQGGAGVYSLPLQHHWQLKTPEWVNDIIPEIMDGKNILDFVDPEIDAKLAELEEEEAQRVELAELQAAERAEMMDDEDAEATAKARSTSTLRLGYEPHAGPAPHTHLCPSPVFPAHTCLEHETIR